VTARIYIVLACIDRWALTSRNVRIRAFAQMKVAKILIICVPLIWSVMTIHVPFYQDIVQGKTLIYHSFIHSFSSHRSMCFHIKELSNVLQYLQYDRHWSYNTHFYDCF